jgi:hypothetical protein
VYVRSLDQLDQLGDEDLLKLAIIAHELYQKLDCATEALSIYDQRTGDALSDHFIESQDLGKPAEATTVSSSG